VTGPGTISFWWKGLVQAVNDNLRFIGATKWPASTANQLGFQSFPCRRAPTNS
jgi:hypothetical protein